MYGQNRSLSIKSAKKKLGQQVATIRKQKGLTQEKLAELSGYSVEFISLIERGINAPTIDGLEKIAQILNCKVEILFQEVDSQDSSLS
jgi:XRE family transcriptional regulator, regulator of sulfur utilization